MPATAAPPLTQRDLKDELFLLEMMTTTELEREMNDEDEAFELLDCMFCVSWTKITGHQARVAQREAPAGAHRRRRDA